jgi:dephospho-CoA kinase
VIDTGRGLDAARAQVAEIVGMVLSPGWKRPVRTLSEAPETSH